MAVDGRDRTQEGLFEGLNGSGLRGVDLACGDGGEVVIFAADGRAGQTAKHGKLAGVGEGVGDGSLKKAIEGRVGGFIGSQILIEGGERGEKLLLLFGPGERLGVVPRGFALRHGKRPVEEIAHVGEDLDRETGTVEFGEGHGGVFEGSRGAIGERGQGVAEEVGLRVHEGNIAQVEAGEWIKAAGRCRTEMGTTAEAGFGRALFASTGNL